MNMLNIPVPYARLLMVQERLDLDEESLRLLSPYRPVFTARKEDFAEHFNNVQAFRMPGLSSIMSNG